MDEPIFENRYLDTEETYMEISRALPGILRPILQVIMVLHSLKLATDAYWEIRWGFGFFYLGLCLFMTAGTVWFFLQPRLAARSYLRKQTEFHDGVIPPIELQFMEDRVVYRQGTRRIELPYRKLTRISATRHLLLLRAGKGAYVTLHKEGFTKGSCPELLRFLQEKCPELKLPKAE